MAYCVNCGNVVRVDGNFCESCGSPVNPTGCVTAPTPSPASGQFAAPLPPSEPPQGTGGRDLARIAAIIVLLGFFLPWVSCPGLTGQASASGVDLARNGAGGLWIVPISMVIALIVLLSGNKTASERSTAALIAIVSGIVNVVVLLYYLAQFNGVGQRDDFGISAAVRQAFDIEIGAMLSFFGSIAVCIGGLIYRTSAAKLAPQPNAPQRPSTIPP